MPSETLDNRQNGELVALVEEGVKVRKITCLLVGNFWSGLKNS